MPHKQRELGSTVLPRTHSTHPHVGLVRRVDADGREVEEAGVAWRALQLQAGVEQQMALRLEPVVVRLDALHHVLMCGVSSVSGVGGCHDMT